jgi:hypothetical protein
MVCCRWYRLRAWSGGLGLQYRSVYNVWGSSEANHWARYFSSLLTPFAELGVTRNGASSQLDARQQLQHLQSAEHESPPETASSPSGKVVSLRRVA